MTASDRHHRPTGLADLAIVIVSTNEAHWLTPCLSTIFERSGGASLDVIVVDNASTDGTRELVESRFPQARVVPSENRGFAHGNNRGLEAAHARYSLLLNPDTEVVGGTFAELIAELDARPEVGVAGVRQVKADGTLCRSIHRFPTVSRAFGEALFSERWPIRPAWAGERELDWDVYDREVPCDWPTGSFMLMRREALLSVGLLDERFFLQCEEPDLCLRAVQAGWQVRYLPVLTVVHHAEKAGVQPRMIVQDTYARMQYASKHFSAGRRRAYLSARLLRHAVRSVGWSREEEAAARREGARRALLTLLGRLDPPFIQPPPTALAPARPASAAAEPVQRELIAVGTGEGAGT